MFCCLEFTLFYVYYLPFTLSLKSSDVKAGKLKMCGSSRIWDLGSRFRADGDQLTDVTVRITSVTSTAGKMCAIWASKMVTLKLKLQIYKTGVCSKLTYGAEAWSLTPKACGMIHGVNSRMMTRITKKTVHEETTKGTQAFDMVSWIRSRRIQWVGHRHILRMNPARLVYKALYLYYEHTPHQRWPPDGSRRKPHVEKSV